MQTWQVMDDAFYMRQALQCAAVGNGQTGLNPTVGCVLVNEGRIVGFGAHLKRGEAHAEVHALRMAGEQARGATAYVTLEPCSHTGKTGPCALALIDAGVKRVVVATLDPNPLVCGNGVKLLCDAGIEVHIGVLEQEAKAQIAPFEYVIKHQLPYVTCKVASTLDGKIASVSGDSKWITNPESRQFVHQLRAQHQAILTGIQTIMADDPQLTVRLDIPTQQPLRFVVDSTLRVPLDARILTENPQHTIIVCTQTADPHKRAQIEQIGAQVWICGDGAQVNLLQLLQDMRKAGIASVLLEAGGKLNGAMLEAGLVQQVVLFFAPKWIGGAMATPNFDLLGISKMADAFTMENVRTLQFGNDICIIGYPVKRSHEK